VDWQLLVLTLGGIYLLSRKVWRELREDPEVCPVDFGPVDIDIDPFVTWGLSAMDILNMAYTPYADWITEAAKEHKIEDPLLISAIIWVESTGDPEAEGCGKNPDTRGLGLMQLTLSTARWIGYARPRSDLKVPDLNIQWGSKYLGYLLKRYGSVRTALKRYRGSTKASTNENYANKVLGVYNELVALREQS